MGTPHTGVTTLTCQGHVTFPHLIPQVPFPIGALLYVTESVSPTIFEIMGIFLYLVTTLTFLGHVTPSVTWQIDPPYVISYWCPIVT